MTGNDQANEGIMYKERETGLYTKVMSLKIEAHISGNDIRRFRRKMI